MNTQTPYTLLVSMYRYIGHSLLELNVAVRTAVRTAMKEAKKAMPTKRTVEVVEHQGCQGPGRNRTVLRYRRCNNIDLMDVRLDGSVLRRATIKCSLQIEADEVDVRLDSVLRRATIKCSLQIRVGGARSHGWRVS
jgi:hypothetical protein